MSHPFLGEAEPRASGDNSSECECIYHIWPQIYISRVRNDMDGVAGRHSLVKKKENPSSLETCCFQNRGAGPTEIHEEAKPNTYTYRRLHIIHLEVNTRWTDCTRLSYSREKQSGQCSANVIKV